LKLRILPEAALDIADQTLYYEEQADTSLGQRWEASVEAAIGSLRIFPERGPRLDSEQHGVAMLRKLHIEGFPNHLILYRFDAPASTIFIVHVLHGARDIDSLLESST
jgi:plasmid stabilization system protein ParE